MKFKIYLILIISFAVVLFLGFSFSKGSNTYSGNTGDKHPDVDWTISCSDCHKDVTPDIFDAWSESRHGQVNFGCYICHGDGEETFHAKGTDERCSGCHAGQEVNFENTNLKSCFDCHNGHTLKFHN